MHPITMTRVSGMTEKQRETIRLKFDLTAWTAEWLQCRHMN